MTDLVKRDPFRNLFAWPRWMEDFDERFTQRGLKIRETDKEIVAEAVVAGVPSKNVEVEIEDGVLTIKADTKEESGKGTEEYKASAYQYYYTAALSGGQWDKTEAKVKDGVVTVKIPKTEAARPRKVTVKAES